MTLDDVKVYLRIDGTDDDSLLTSLMSAADLFIVNAVGDAVDKTSDLYALAQKLLISHWYEDRLPYVNYRTAKLDFAIESIINQLKYTLPSTTTTPLTVTTSPTDGAVNIAVTSQLLWTFSVAIEANTMTSANLFVMDSTGNLVDGVLSLSTDGLTVSFQPSSNLAATTPFTMVATTNVRDITGNTMVTNNVTNFTTA